MNIRSSLQCDTRKSARIMTAPVDMIRTENLKSA